MNQYYKPQANIAARPAISFTREPDIRMPMQLLVRLYCLCIQLNPFLKVNIL